MSAKTKIITLIAILIVCLGMIVYGTISEGNSIMDIMPRLILMGLTAVVVIIRIASNSPKKQSLDIESLKNDIVTAKEWIKTALESSGYQADFSLESLRDIDRFFDEMGMELRVIATGGLASTIVRHCKHDITLDNDLIMKGLNILYKKNK